MKDSAKSDGIGCVNLPIPCRAAVLSIPHSAFRLISAFDLNGLGPRPRSGTYSFVWTPGYAGKQQTHFITILYGFG